MMLNISLMDSKMMRSMQLILLSLPKRVARMLLFFVIQMGALCLMKFMK